MFLISSLAGDLDPDSSIIFVPFDVIMLILDGFDLPDSVSNQFVSKSLCYRTCDSLFCFFEYPQAGERDNAIVYTNLKWPRPTLLRISLEGDSNSSPNPSR